MGFPCLRALCFLNHAAEVADPGHRGRGPHTATHLLSDLTRLEESAAVQMPEVAFLVRSCWDTGSRWECFGRFPMPLGLGELVFEPVAVLINRATPSSCHALWSCGSMLLSLEFRNALTLSLGVPDGRT